MEHEGEYATRLAHAALPLPRIAVPATIAMAWFPRRLPRPVAAQALRGLFLAFLYIISPAVISTAFMAQ